MQDKISMCHMTTAHYCRANKTWMQYNSTLLQDKQNINAIQQHIIAGQAKHECNTTPHYCRANPTGEGSIELSSASLGSGNHEEGGRWLNILRPFLRTKHGSFLTPLLIEPSKILDSSQKQVRVSSSRVLIEPLGSVWASSRARINNSRDFQLPPFHSKQVRCVVVSWSWQSLFIVVWKKRWSRGLWVL